MGTLDGKIAIVTGSGQGIGRSEAFALAHEGAHVIVNDVSEASGGDNRPADEVVAEIKATGGSAESNFDDISDWDGAQRLIEQAVAYEGHLDILVCNAGIVRDRMLVNMTEIEWDAVIRVHLKGHFGPLHFAAAHWRERSRAGDQSGGRVITTSSEAGLFGHEGQVNYSAAKAGILGITLAAARELDRYAVTVNSICPRARTPMTEGVVPDMDPVAGIIDDWDPDNVSPLVTFLSGPDAAEISGQVFVVHGGTVARMQLWVPLATIVSDSPWSQKELARRGVELGEGLVMRNAPFDELLVG